MLNFQRIYRPGLEFTTITTRAATPMFLQLHRNKIHPRAKTFGSVAIAIEGAGIKIDKFYKDSIQFLKL